MFYHKKTKNLLKKRYKIKYLNAKIKNNNRINLRKERKFQNYVLFYVYHFYSDILIILIKQIIMNFCSLHWQYKQKYKKLFKERAL